jgi:hypothetical protein
VLHVFERLEAIASNPDYRGCPFVSTAIELKDADHPASLVARQFNQALTDFFRDELTRGGAHDPDTLAKQLTIVFDGANARAVVQTDPLAGLAVATATTLLDAANVRSDA